MAGLSSGPSWPDAIAPSRRAVPPALFKYRPLTADARAFTARLITDGELYFASPRTFNDPFDTLPHLMLRGDRGAMLRHLKRITSTNLAGRPRGERRRAYATMRRSTRGEREAVFREAATDGLGRIGVCCLAETHSQILMWSHYADQHRGVCIALDPRRLLDGQSLPLPVHYADDRPTYNPLESRTDGLLDGVMIKASTWAYEKEWRIVIGDPAVKRYGSGAVTGVYLGCRVSTDDLEYVVELATRQRPPVPVFQATPSETAFALNFEQVA